MSIQVGSGHYAYSDVVVASATGAAMTVCFWIKPPAGVIDLCALWSLGNPADESSLGLIRDGATNNTYLRWVEESNAYTSSASYDMRSAWVFVAISRANNTSRSVYLKSDTISWVKTDITDSDTLADDWTYERYGCNGGGTDPFTGLLANFKSWTVALSEAELQAEMASQAVVKTANLHRHCILPSHTDLTDDSGNDRDLSVIGTLTTGADDPTYPATVQFARPASLQSVHRFGPHGLVLMG